MGQVVMQACKQESNISREYLCVLDRDLFGHYVLKTSWGRIGGHMQSRTVSFSNEIDALKGTSKILKRRSTLRKRIGVSYQIIENNLIDL